MAVLNTDYILTQIKLKGTIPSGRFDDDEILNVVSDVLLTQVVPMIVSLREEYYVQSEDSVINASQASYDIPYRAMGQSLREAKILRNSSLIDIPRISPEEITTTTEGQPKAFYLQAGSVVLYPTPSSTDGSVLRQSYYKTPNRPVGVSECALITSIDSVTGIITATTPSTWTTANYLDLISQWNGHKCLATDILASNIDPTFTTVTLSVADIPSGLSIGDYIALAGESPFLEVPDICVDLIIRLSINDLLESMGDQAALQAGMVKAEVLKQNAVALLTNRVAGAPKRSKITLI